ncbi:NaeI family type II restriction endonuclease [Streptomyces sp. NPDC001586]|uniref:NaeI family type II restriction endonuclease n=1 Tax=Streptomyces sp. NPDC001586 TaxID=3154387 RepID=UPI00332FC7D5
MTSDPAQPSSPSELRRLLEVLDRAGGHGATPTELAELIWLARHRGTPEHAAQVGSEEPVREGSASARGEAPESAVPGDGQEPPQEPGRPGLPLSHRSDTEPSDDGPYASLLAPLPPMLAHPLPLQRALRPLRRRVPSRLETDLDERNTAYGIARQGAWPGTWLPELRARPERWLTLYLVYDAGPTMPIWRPLLQELRRVIGQTGAFRGIQLLELTRHGRLRQSPGGRPAVLPPRDGRAVALILSDCSGPAWYAGSEAAADWYRTLGRWSRTMPVAVVQPLPERLWRRTALPGSAGLLTARGLAAPNSGLRFAPYDGPGEGRPAGASLPLPLLEPSARWFAHWARLVAGPPGTTVPGVVATLPTASSAVPLDLGASSPQDLSPEEQVLNFRAHASPQALRLAAHLAVGKQPSIPVMRLVQAATERRPEPQHLAEVILSGLLTTVPGRLSASGHYKFRPGVREVLIRTLPRSMAARIDAVIQHYAGSRLGEFPVTVPTEDTTGARGCPHGEPLAVVTEETVQSLGRSPGALADGPGTLVDRRYRLVQRQHARETSDTWRATDDQLGREVVLKLFHVPMVSQAESQRFLADAERLATLDIQGLARIEGFGFHDDRPFLVTDPVDGEDFGQLLKLAPGNMTLEVIRAIGGQIAETLNELHLNGLLHLDLSPSALVVRPDGRVLVTDPGLGVHGLAGNDGGGFRRSILDQDGPLPPYGSPEQLFDLRADHRSDLYSLGCLLYAMATGAAPALGVRVLRNAWMHGTPHPHPKFRSGFTPEFDALVTDLLATDPKYRPARAGHVLHRLMGTRADDEELTAVADAVLALDPDGIRMGRLLRDAIDAVLDGPQTGRYDWRTLFKTEKTHFGTQVEISIQREFAFADGIDMDYRIAGVDVDCKYSQQFGSWMIPPEVQGHLCLLVWADDHQSRWSAGLLRIRNEWLNAGKNRDLKLTIKAEHRDKIFWLWHQAELPENILLHMPGADREAVLGKPSGQARLNELFRRVQQRRIGRNVVRSVAQQEDYMKRIRGNGGSRSVLRSEGIIIMGDYRAHQDIARQLGLPVPQKGEFVSARVVPAVPGSGKPAAAMDGGLWSLASPGDDAVTAPILPSTSASGGA